MKHSVTMTACVGWMCLGMIGAASAATNYWDTNGATEGFGTAGGTWGVDPFWSGDAAGLSVPAVTHTTDADDLVFGTRQHGLAAGTLAVDGSAQAFRSLRFGAASGPVTIAGGTLTPAAPLAPVAIENASNTLASALAGAGGIHLVTAPRLTATNFLTAASATLFTNAVLADYIHAGGILSGAWVPRQPANAYHFVRSGETATFQLQVVHDGYTKCVKVELVQSGSNITGRAVYAKNLSGSNLGFDFDAGGTDTTLAESSSANGYGVDQTALLPTPLASDPFVAATAATLVPGSSLAGVREIHATLAGAAISGGMDAARPFFFQNDGALATVQMQAFNGNYTKCVKLELTQDGADIKGRILYAKYYNSVGMNVLGYDFDQGGTANSIASSFTVGSYGLCQLRLYNACRLRLTGTNTFTGNIGIDPRSQLEIAGEGCLGGTAAAYGGAVTNNGLFHYNSPGNQLLSGPITGTGALVKDSPGQRLATVTHAAFLTLSPATLFVNLRLADCAGASGLLGGKSINRGSPAVPETFHFRRTDTEIAFQFQLLDDVYTKCVKVILTQSGPDVLGRAAYAKYVSGDQRGYDFDTGGTAMNLATAQDADGYGVAETALEVASYGTLSLSGTNSYTGGTTVRRGTLEALATNALPAAGGITVEPGAELVLKAGELAYNNAGGVGNGNPVTVLAGGLLTLASPFNAGYSRLITLKGGTLNGRVTQNNDSANYINNLALQDGARVTGFKIRVGAHAAALITVGGNAPSSLEAGINMVNNANRPLTLDVADVTGDDAVDFSIPAEIRDYSDLYTNMPIIKAGAGTASLSGTNTHAGPVTVAAGTLALDAAGALNAGNALILAGGALAMGSHSNAVGTLTLAADSALVLGEGHLAFAASQGAAWTNGCTLTLVGSLGARSVRVGTDSASLTPAQLAAITCNGASVRLTSQGYLSPHSRGTLVLLQ